MARECVHVTRQANATPSTHHHKLSFLLMFTVLLQNSTNFEQIHHTIEIMSNQSTVSDLDPVGDYGDSDYASSSMNYDNGSDDEANDSDYGGEGEENGLASAQHQDHGHQETQQAEVRA